MEYSVFRTPRGVHRTPYGTSHPLLLATYEVEIAVCRQNSQNRSSRPSKEALAVYTVMIESLLM